MCTRERG